MVHIMPTKPGAGSPRAERDAFAALYDRYCNPVYNHCFRRTGSWAASEELMATVFLEAWRRRHRHIPVDPEGVLPWLLAVANNILRNTRRAERRYAAVLARIPRAEALPDPAGAVAAKLDAERWMARSLPALQALPAREREVIELCAGTGLTHTEAAQVIGVPVGTVKSRLSRGLARLRQSGAAADHPASPIIDEVTKA